MKNYCYISNQHPPNCLIANFVQKLELLNMEPRMPYLGSNFEKPLSYLELAHSNLSDCKILRKNENINLGPKMSYLRIFGL